MRKGILKSSKSKLVKSTKKCCKPNRGNSVPTDASKDPESVILFGPWNIPTQRKDISKIYKKRQSALIKGHCVFCCENLTINKVNKDFTCPNCKKNLLDCFERGGEDKNINILMKLM